MLHPADARLSALSGAFFLGRLYLHSPQSVTCGYLDKHISANIAVLGKCGQFTVSGPTILHRLQFSTFFTIVHIFAQVSLTILIDVIFRSAYRASRLNREAKNFTDQLRRRSELNRTQRREIETQSSKPLWKSSVVQFVCTLWLNGAS